MYDKNNNSIIIIKQFFFHSAKTKFVNLKQFNGKGCMNAMCPSLC